MEEPPDNDDLGFLRARTEFRGLAEPPLTILPELVPLFHGTKDAMPSFRNP